MNRHSELTPAEASQVHAAAVAAQLFPVRIEVDITSNLVFFAGEQAFEHLADWLARARELGELRRAATCS